MKWVGAVLLFVAAALVFSFTEPLYQPEILKALVVAVVTGGLVFAITGPDDAVPKATDSIRKAGAVVILLAGAIATFGMFTSPTVGILFALLLLGGFGYVLYDVLNRRGGIGAEPLTTGHLMKQDANSSVMDLLREGVQLGFHQDLLAIKNQVALQIHQLTTTHDATRLIGHQTETEIAALKGAARREIPRIDYTAFRLAELQGMGEQELRRFELDLKLEEKERGHDLDFNAAKQFATRKLPEVKTIRESLVDFHNIFATIKHSSEPEDVKREKLADIVNIIKGLRRDLRERLGIEPDDEDMDR